MKKFLAILSVALTLGCTAVPKVHVLDVDNQKVPGVAVITADTGIDTAGGPRARTTYLIVYNKDGTIKSVLQNSHAGPGSLQTVLPAIVHGGAMMATGMGSAAIAAGAARDASRNMADAIKNRAPSVVQGDTRTQFIMAPRAIGLGGSSSATAIADQKQGLSSSLDFQILK